MVVAALFLTEEEFMFFFKSPIVEYKVAALFLTEEEAFKSSPMMRPTQRLPVEFLSNPAKIWLLAGVLLLLGLGACTGESPPKPRTFLFVDTATGALFRAQTSLPAVIAQAEAELDRPFSERQLFPIGPIARSDGGHNAPWSWHFVPDRWELTEVSIEVCDATPAYVEANLDYFVETLGNYCPWSARLVRSAEEARARFIP